MVEMEGEGEQERQKEKREGRQGGERYNHSVK